MKKIQENELMMEEIAVKNLQEISGGVIAIDIPTTAGIISKPILTGLIRPTTGMIAPKLSTNIIDLK